jgi:hypothetical protein
VDPEGLGAYSCRTTSTTDSWVASRAGTLVVAATATGTSASHHHGVNQAPRTLNQETVGRPQRAQVSRPAWNLLRSTRVAAAVTCARKSGDA